MAETAIYLALRKIGIALGREKSTTSVGQDHEGGSTAGNECILVVLKIFSRTLPELITEEISVTRPAEFQGRLRRIESELRMIHCFLAQMETRYDNKQVLQSWIGEARKLGCLVEQTMDEYIVRIIQREGEGFRKGLLGLPSFALASRRLAAQLKEIEVELEHLSKMKKRWVQVDKETSLPINYPCATREGTERYVYEEKKEKLIELLNNGGTALSVIAVCGQGGSGKTHLVRDVYDSVKKYFDIAAWTSLAQCPNSDIAVLRKTMEELQIKVDVSPESNPVLRNTMEEQQIEADVSPESNPVKMYIKLLMEHLQKKKFLFVFDDVRVPDAVRKARHASFDNKMGSRIIIITRMPGVASVSECNVDAEVQTRASSSEPAGSFVNKGKARASSSEPAGSFVNKGKALKTDDETSCWLAASRRGKKPTLSVHKRKGFCPNVTYSNTMNLDRASVQIRCNKMCHIQQKNIFEDKGSSTQKQTNGKGDHEASGQWQASKKFSDIGEFIEITCLYREDALKLFYTKAFGNSSGCPEQLKTTSAKIVDLCDYLPQAIVSIGASLSLKQKTESVWSEMAQQIEHIKRSKASLNDVQKIAYLSYKNLPMHLKNCLLYCSIFPAGFLLLPERLARLWTAEGFIEKQVSSQLEDTAKRYIKELINWGFLQTVEDDELGRVACCRMPTVVHELAVSISQKEEFGAACHGVKLAEMDSNVRCLFISEYPEDFGAVVDFPYLRSIIASDSAAACFPSLPASLPAKLNYLTVLELQGSPIKKLPSNIGYQLFNLRYLGLRKTEVQQLPFSMCRLYSLQTLDLKWSRIQELPNWIGDLMRLRHLFADTLLDESRKEFLYFNCLKAPKGLKYLKELQTLETVQASSSFEKAVDKLTQLTSLSVGNMEGRSCRTLFASLSKLSSLSSLLISASNEREFLRFQALNPVHLEKLVIRGSLADQKFHSPIFQSEKLKALKFSWCNLWDDSLTLLSTNLPNLESLSLHRVRGITKLVFRTGESFAKLRTLELLEIDGVNELDIQCGSLNGLQVLHVESLHRLNQLNSIRDLEVIRSVRKLYFPQLMAIQRENDMAASSSQHYPIISQE